MKLFKTTYRLIGGKDGDLFHRKVLGEFVSEQEAVRCAASLQNGHHIDWWIISETGPGTFKVVCEDTGRFAPQERALPPGSTCESSRGLSQSSSWGSHLAGNRS